MAFLRESDPNFPWENSHWDSKVLLLVVFCFFKEYHHTQRHTHTHTLYTRTVISPCIVLSERARAKTRNTRRNAVQQVWRTDFTSAHASHSYLSSECRKDKGRRGGSKRRSSPVMIAMTDGPDLALYCCHCLAVWPRLSRAALSPCQTERGSAWPRIWDWSFKRWGRGGIDWFLTPSQPQRSYQGGREKREGKDKLVILGIVLGFFSPVFVCCCFFCKAPCAPT